MEITKKIIYILSIIAVISACIKSENLYNQQGQKLSIYLKDLKWIKHNLYFFNDSIVVLLDFNVLGYYKANDSIGIKHFGKIVIDTIFNQKTFKDGLISVSESIDLKSYDVVLKDKIYKDKENIYLIYSMNNTNLPFQILNLESSTTRFMGGGYMKDNHIVYHYGTKVEKADVKSFIAIKLKDSVTNQIYFYGKDKNSLYFNESPLNISGIKELRIKKNFKDSLLSLLTNK